MTARGRVEITMQQAVATPSELPETDVSQTRALIHQVQLRYIRTDSLHPRRAGHCRLCAADLLRRVDVRPSWQYGLGRDCYVTLPVLLPRSTCGFFASRTATSASLPEPHFEMHCMTLIAGRFNRCTRLVAMI